MKNLEKSHFRSLICFLVVMTFIIICLVYAFFCDSSFIVNAEQQGYISLVDYFPNINDYVINQDGYISSDIYNSKTYYPQILTNSSNISNYLDNDDSNGEIYITQNNLECSISKDWNDGSQIESYDISPQNCDFLFISCNDYEVSISCFKIIQSSDIRFLNVNGYNYLSCSPFHARLDIYGFPDATWSVNQAYSGTFDSNGICKIDTIGVTHFGTQCLNLGDGNYRGFMGLGEYMNIFYCSEPLLSNLNDEIATDLGLGFDSINFYDVNYHSVNSDTDNSYPDGSGGDDSNNLYLSNARWDFGSVPKWRKNITSESTIYFRGDLNDYQVDNLDNFHLNYSYIIQFTAKGNWDGHSSGGGHGISLIDALSSKKKTFTFKFKNPENDLTYWSQPLNTFYQLGSISSHRTRGFIYSNCVGVGESPVSFQTFIDDLDISNYTDIKCVLTCTSILQDEEGNSSGLCESWINLYDNSSGNNSDSMGVNKNPYENDSSNSENSQGGSNQVSSSDGKIIINNTNNNTLNGGDNNLTNSITSNKNPISTLLDNLFGGGTVQEGAIGGNTISKVNDITGANNYINYMNNTFSFIPNTVWSEILIFFGICLSILVVGFILRIILDFL